MQKSGGVDEIALNLGGELFSILLGGKFQVFVSVVGFTLAFVIAADNVLHAET